VPDAAPRRDGSGLARHGKAVELAEAELGKSFQRVPHRRVDGAGASLSLADESIAANLPKVPDAKLEEVKVPSLREGTQMTRVCGPIGESERSGKSKSARQVPVSG
jgi:hypothetical protein